VQKEIVRRALREVRGNLKDVSTRHVENVLRLAQIESGSECHLGNGVRVRREFELLTFGGEKATPQFVYELPIPGDVYISEIGKRIVARRLPGNPPNARAGCDRPGRILLDFSGSCLAVRNRRAGDRYRTGTQIKKLKEILIERRIPRSRRDELIVLDDGGRIVWVEGLMPDPDFRAEPGLEQALEIAVEHETFPR